MSRVKNDTFRSGANPPEITVRSQLPAVIPPTPLVSEWPNRPTPPVVRWEPGVPKTMWGRSAARRAQRGFELSKEVVDSATRVIESLARYEQARQSLEYVYGLRELLPLRLMQERLLLNQELGKALADDEEVWADLENRRLTQSRRRLLTEEDFRLEVLRRDAERRELEARIAAANAQSAFASRIGTRRGEADLHRAHESTLRAQASAERERSRLDAERASHQNKAGPADDMPEPLRRFYATQREVNENVAEAARRAQAIRDRATRERRDQTEDEMQEIDALEDAARAAESSIRRGSAADLGG